MSDVEKNNQTVRHIYIALIISIILQFVPVVTLSVFGTFLFLAVFIWAYIARSRYGPATLVENHTTYIIRTVWIFSVLLLIGMVICGFWFMEAFDRQSLADFSQSVMTTAGAGSTDFMEAYRDLANANFKLLAIAVPVTIGPSVIYLGYRLFKGAARGIKGYRVDHPESWL